MAFFMAVMLPTANVQGQQEWRVGLGINDQAGQAPNSQNSSLLGQVFGVAFTSILSPSSNPNTVVRVVEATTQDEVSLNLSLAYSHLISQRFSLGIQLNYNPLTRTHTDRLSNGFTRRRSEKLQVLSLAGRIDYRYVVNPRFQLYSSMLLGAASNLSAATYGKTYFHFFPLGLRFGEQNAFWAEFGFGTGPVISLGYAICIPTNRRE